MVVILQMALHNFRCATEYNLHFYMRHPVLNMADVVLECVGAPPAVVEGMEMCRDGGKYLILGHYCDAGPVLWNPHVITRKQLQVSGSWSSEPRHLAAAINFLRANPERFPFAQMVSHRFTLGQANEALQTTARWEALKSVIVPG